MFPQISSFCLDRHLSDHRPIILREIFVDYGATPFRLFHSWFSWDGFDNLVADSWNGLQLEDRNDMVRFKKKLQGLKKAIRVWVMDRKKNHNLFIKDTKLKLGDIDKKLDCGEASEELLLLRMNLMQSLQEKKYVDARDSANLSIRGVMVDGEWIVEPIRVKEAFRNHFASRFHNPSSGCSRINFTFPNRLSQEQIMDLENHVSTDEIRKAPWECGENKSPGPDGNFLRGCNSSFVALILKVPDAKFVSDFRPISLLGSMYKVITKILANRLSSVISDLVSDVQTTFVSGRQILGGPFIINELLSWCKRKKKHAMLFKVDFAKAYDSVRWDFLDDVLRSFGFGSKWRSWISGCLSSAMASVIVNGSPTSKFQFQCGLKQGDPIAPYLFILVMESLHLSFSRVVEAGMYKGIVIDNSVMISHVFYADDAVFVGEWSDSNLDRILHVLHCFYLTSGLKINVQKSSLMGVGVNHNDIAKAASKLGCSILKTPFKYLGVSVGSSSYRVRAWEDTLCKLKSRLSKWKAKTLSIGGISYLAKSCSWCHSDICYVANGSPWVSILREVQSLKVWGIDLVCHCKKRVGDGLSTCFWEDTWMGDRPLKLMFPRIYALESNKLCTVAEKRHPNALDQTFRRNFRGGVELHQYMQLQDLIGAFIFSNSTDRWVWDLNGSGNFIVKDVRSMIDDFMLPKESDATRWIKCIPNKVNVFAWKVLNDRLATKSNLIHRGIPLDSPMCPVCNLSNEDVSHILFCCDLASLVSRRICRWWNLDWQQVISYSEWFSWLKSIRMEAKLKSLSNAVFIEFRSMYEELPFQLRRFAPQLHEMQAASSNETCVAFCSLAGGSTSAMESFNSLCIRDHGQGADAMNVSNLGGHLHFREVGE
ncbi:RNA-directed DNA polymerase, eukaryota [Tanacetum coccineum]|uniref:RNA-directed DNA polymerase, eukaryota n=1 Tax=Tanacetum coccineum TaxID=301880 RepID=A0ABQ4Y556_9ASTR